MIFQEFLNAPIFLLFTFMVSLLLTFKFIPKIIQISFSKKLFDHISERKVHTGLVPRLGGVAFMPSIIFSISLTLGIFHLFSPTLPFLEMNYSSFFLGISAITLLYFEGLCDDLIGIHYKWKFLVQFICAFLVCCSGVYFQSLYGLFGVTLIPTWLGIGLSTLFIVFVINAINLIDGIDGLSSSLSSIALIGGLILLYAEKDLLHSLIAIASLGTILSFFYYNVFGKVELRRKIFMGDAGSQIIGFILGQILISSCEGMDKIVANFSTLNPIIISLALIFVPTLDVLRVMLHRIKKKTNPFKPDQNHIHHKFLKLGFSPRESLVIIILLALFFILWNISLSYLQIDVHLILFSSILLWTFLNIYLTRKIATTDSNSL